MTRPPHDPDPLHHPWSEPELVTPDPARLRRGIAIGFVIEVIVIGLAVLGAWLLLSGLQFGEAATSEAPPVVDPVATVDDRVGDVSPPSVAASAVIPPTGAIGTVLYSGLSTWYCGMGSPCTRGYGPLDMVAAIDPTLGIAKGERVRVNHEGKSVTVRIVDVCACAGARLIDLTSGAFLRLASTDLGVIPVTVEVLGATRTLPPTDTPEATP